MPVGWGVWMASVPTPRPTVDTGSESGKTKRYLGTGSGSGKTTLRRQDEGGWCCRRRARPGPHRGCRIGVRQDDTSPARRGRVVLQSPRRSQAPSWLPDRSPARRHFAGKTRWGGVAGDSPVPRPTVGTGSGSGKTTLRRQDEGGRCCRRRARPNPHRGYRIGVRHDDTSPAR